MKRYSLFQGVRGKLVGDPREDNPRNGTSRRLFVGQKRKPFDADASWRSLSDLYDPCEQVAEHDELRKAVKAGELLLIAGPVSAASLGEAAAKLKRQPKPQPKPALAKTEKRSRGGDS